MNSIAPPSLVFDITVDNIAERTGGTIEKRRAAYKQIASVETPTFDTVIKPYGQLENEVCEEIKKITFLQHLGTSEELRQKSREADEKLKAFDAEHYLDSGLYKAIQSVYNSREEMEKLDAQDRRYVEKLVQAFVRNGQKLNERQRNRLAGLRKKVADLENEIKQTITSKKYNAFYTRKQLSSLPQTFFAGRESIEGKAGTLYSVTQNVRDLAAVASTGFAEGNTSLVDENHRQNKDLVSLTEKLVKRRAGIAELLGYTTYAEYMLNDRMLRGPKAATDFIDKFKEMVKDGEAETLRSALLTSNNSKDKGIIESLVSMFKPKPSKETVKKYFPLQHTLRQILHLFEDLLSISIRKLEDSVSTWHKDVQVYEVWEKDMSAFVGHMYLDLYARKGKGNNIFAWQLRPGYVRSNDQYSHPAAAMCASFDNPSSVTAPVLLAHTDILGLFHELGHVFQVLCARAKWSRFGGLDVERDFVETPAHMMEHWAWEPSVLKKISAHYQSGKPVPDDAVDFIIQQKAQHNYLVDLSNCFVASFDISIHNRLASPDLQLVRMEDVLLQWNLTLLLPQSAPFKFSVHYGHIVSGYDAGMYGYLLSRVISADLFASKFLKEGIDNPQTGMQFRQKILSYGASRDASVSLKDFLGREYSSDAFKLLA